MAFLKQLIADQKIVAVPDTFKDFNFTTAISNELSGKLINLKVKHIDGFDFEAEEVRLEKLVGEKTVKSL